MNNLKDKNAIITGAARGIGRSIAVKYAQEGANVAYTDIMEDDNFNSLKKELEGYGVKAEGFISDASNTKSCEELIKKINEKFDSIDILINNAGITKDNLLMRMTEEQWDAVININLKSVFNMTKAVQRTMLKQRSGSIVNISSVVGVGGNAGQSNYSASKAGIIGFTKSIAKELGARNIRSNAIAPGFIETDMTANLPEDVIKEWYDKIPLKRGGKPDDVANACVFFGSDLSSYVTGQCLNVCGALQT